MSAAHVLPVDWKLDDGEIRAELLEMVEQRFEPSVIDRLLNLGLTRDEVHSIVLPARTLQHRRSKKERLSVDESDKVIRLLRMLRLTEEVYGNLERALDWLRTPNPNLDPTLRNILFVVGGPTPMSLLKTGTGAWMVEELLGQISEGMFI